MPVMIRAALCALCLASIFAFDAASPPASQQPLRHITIEATEYAFRVASVVPPGLTAFQFINRGKVTHEVQLFRFNRGVSDSIATAYLMTGNAPDSAADPSGSVLIALRGVFAREQVLVQLETGERYALVCQFRDAPDKPRHASLGMFALLKVQ
jgi:hypothetical protein